MEKITLTEIDKLERSFPLVKFGFIEDDDMGDNEVKETMANLKAQHGVEHVYTCPDDCYSGMIVTDTELSDEVVVDIFASYWEDAIKDHNGGFTANHEYKLGYQYVELDGFKFEAR